MISIEDFNKVIDLLDYSVYTTLYDKESFLRQARDAGLIENLKKQELLEYIESIEGTREITESTPLICWIRNIKQMISNLG